MQSLPAALPGAQLLVALPAAWDWDRFKAVAILSRHDAAGATGLILNRPITASVGRVWGETCSELRDCNEPLYLGGPEQGAFSAIHGSQALGELAIAPGVFCSTDLQLIRRLAARKTRPIRFFLGCIHWNRGQLEQELSAGIWGKTSASSSAVFGSPQGLWESLHSQLAPGLASESLRPRSAAAEPPQPDLAPRP